MMRRVLLAAALTLTDASQAHAADFVDYTFHAEGMASITEYSLGAHSEVVTNVYTRPAYFDGYFNAAIDPIPDPTIFGCFDRTGEYSYCGDDVFISIASVSGNELMLSGGNSSSGANVLINASYADGVINGRLPEELPMFTSATVQINGSMLDYVGRSGTISYIGTSGGQLLSSLTAVRSVERTFGPFNLTITTVPELATWVMMIVGFGVIGLGLRSRRKVTTKVSFA